MSYYEKISCRLAIQVCVGRLPNGRAKHRTFSIKGINPDAPFEAIADVIRALAAVLAYPITKVRKVTKREIIFYEEAVMPIPLDNAVSVPEASRIIPFPVIPATKRIAARKAPTGCLRSAFYSAPVPIMGKSPPRNFAVLPFLSILGRAPPWGRADEHVDHASVI